MTTLIHNMVGLYRSMGLRVAISEARPNINCGHESMTNSPQSRRVSLAITSSETAAGLQTV